MSVITNSVPFAVFGPGSLYVTRNDIAGQTPVNIGYAQEFSYDESAEAKELYGQNQYPLVIARGTIKATGKMKAATVSGLALNAAFNGQSFQTGQLLLAQAEPQTVPAAVTHPTSADTASGDVLPFSTTTGVVVGMSVSGTGIGAGTFVESFVADTSVTLTKVVTTDVPSTTVITFGPSVTVDNADDFDTDLGVLYASSGLPLIYTTGSPAVGEYTYTTAGEYSFNTSDTDAQAGVLITYAYTSSSSGQTMTVMNTPIGNTPTFQIDYATSLYGSPYYVRMFACVSNKLSRAHKLTDFMMPEIDFGFFATANGKVYEVSYPQVS
jgi:hypothetical protein